MDHVCPGCGGKCDCGAPDLSGCVLCFWCDTTNDDDWSNDDYDWDDDKDDKDV